MGNECRGFTFVNKFADGSGGVYTEIVEANSPRCGYVSETPKPTDPPRPSCPPRGTQMGDGCEGNNYVIKYADGNCGTYSTISESNSSRCGGSTPKPTGSPRPTDPPRNLTVTYSTDKQFLTPSIGTETQTVRISGGASNTTYFLTLWNRVEGGSHCTGYHGRLQTDGSGNCTFTLPIGAPNNPNLTPDGQYECWAEIRTIQGSSSYLAKSNSIFRTFSGIGYNTGRRNVAFGITNPNVATGISPWFTMVFTGFNPGENLGWEMVFKHNSGGREVAIYSSYVRANNNGYCIVEYTHSDQGIQDGPGASNIFPDGGYSVYVRVGNSKSNTNSYSSYTGSSLQISNSRFA